MAKYRLKILKVVLHPLQEMLLCLQRCTQTQKLVCLATATCKALVLFCSGWLSID